MQSECTILPYRTVRHYRIGHPDITLSHCPPSRWGATSHYAGGAASHYTGVLPPITLGCCPPLHWGATPHYAGVLRPITHTAAGKAAHMLKTEQDIRFSYNSLKFPRHPHSYSIYTFSSALRLLHFGRYL